MSATDYDVIVIGCGTAGSKAAATAQQLGARVLVLDGAKELGGLCILRGCMPTKTLLETAHRLHEIRDAERFGIRVAPPELDFPAHMARMRELVARFQRAKVGGIERGGYELRREYASFVDPHTVEVAGERIRGKTFVLATGSHVRPLGLEVSPEQNVVTSDDLFLLKEVPPRSLVLGAGAVGLEFAQWLARVGSQVTLASRSPLFHRVDLELGQELHQALRLEMDVCAPSKLLQLKAGPAGSTVARLEPHQGPERQLEVDLVLNATGRVPNRSGLGLDRLDLDPGALRPRETLQCSLDHVFLAGDASGRSAILHEANIEGALAGRNAARVAGVLAGELEVYDPGIPRLEVVFSDPVFASAGLNQQQCRERGLSFREAIKRYPEQGRGIVRGARHGMVKLLAEPGGKILGCQILGPRADDLIHIPAAVLSFGGSVEQMYSLPWYHPTLSEAFLEVCRALLDGA